MKIFHTALTVKNLERSTLFYEAVCDLKVVSEGTRDNLRFTMLADANDVRVELIESDAPKEMLASPADLNELGLKHIAFSVDSIEEVMSRAVGAGGTILMPATEGKTVKRIGFVTDPDGIPIEFVERK